ncbi:MAG: DUF438 domain-containing protein [Candidatus Lokiarchaeota archaeon]|nr:DUF438 domain-containing protein [Candidatus Lokiarchaeota archaeon]
MEVNNKTKILPIIDKYPKVYDEIYKINPRVKRFKNPIARKTIGKKATVEWVSDLLNIPIEKLISIIQGSVESSSGEMTYEERKDILKDLLLKIHEGGEFEELKEMFRNAVGDITAPEIGQLEQELINEGSLEIKDIAKLSDLHVALFKESLDEKPDFDTIPGHPIHTYLQENIEIINLIRQIRSAQGEEKLRLFKELSQVEIHYTRKENQVFPILEKIGISGPPQVMWAVHDKIRAGLKTEKAEDIESILEQVEDMIYKEEHILFPMILEGFEDVDWVSVREGEEEIGYAFGVTPGTDWKPITAGDVHKPVEVEAIGDKLNLDVGNLSPEQINIMLKALPVDITFVNEKDEVAYYSDTEDRIFPRSKGIIGRAVQNCHPPKSVHVVEDILKKFKSGEKDVAEFWIQMDSNFILIRYFAMRDEEGKYVGTLEVSQELSRLRALEGERRLVQWS